MKRIITVFLCMIMIVIMSTGTVFAASDDRALSLPEDDGTGYPVTGITDSYNNDDEVIKVIVPENILRLGERAFWGCSNLNQIKLHNKIQLIGEQAFEGTAYYKDQDNWEDGVLYIGDCLIKANPDEISDTYVVRNGTRLIADGAFKNCKRLSALIIPDTIEYVGTDAFVGTAFFENQNNWSDNTLILDYLLLSVNKEYTGAFFVPDGIRTIADSAFKHSKLTELITSDSLKHIGYNAFFDCQELKTVSLGKSVETLGRGPFRMCTKLATITVHEENEHYSIVDGVLYNKQLSEVMRCPQKLAEKVILPHSTKKINAYAFELCTEIKSVEIPEGCIFIGNSAFSVCEKLSDIVIPQTMEYIDHYAFSYCNSIESILIPDNVFYLGKYVFTCCMNLKEVELGNGITKLRDGLFESAEKLNAVSLGESIEDISDSAFSFTKYVADISKYQNGLLIASDKYLIKVAKDVTVCYVPSGVTVIADGAFDYPSREGFLTEIHMPSSLVRFNYGAFYDVPYKTPVYYNGTIEDFIDITNFDWDCINLHTTDFKTTIWAVVSIGGILVIFTTVIIVVNHLKKRGIQETELEDDYAEE